MIPSNEPQKIHGQDKNVPLVMVPAVLPSTAMFVPTNVNLPQFYCLPQNIELAKMMQMNAQLSLFANANNSNPHFYPPPAQVPNYDVSNLKDQLHELTRIALNGCDVGETIALSHQKRPCFKKIDSLCARLKQDLLRPDNVIANINSQGVAWAVKDFIFVFTRIINAWIIIKDYANNQSEGLQKVRSAYSPNFCASFEKWQDSTIDFIDQLIKSFAGLDDLVQSQRTQNYTPSKEDHLNVSGGSSNDSLKSGSSKNSVLISNSESVQAKHDEAGTYFKTGVYEPLLKRESPRKEEMQHLRGFQATGGGDVPKRGVDLDDYSKMSVLKSIWTRENDFHATWNRYLLEKILNLKEGEYFFTSHFMENYFPGFTKYVPNYIDLRTIVFKLEVGDYLNIYEVVHDLRQILYSGNVYLQHQSNHLMAKSLNSFEYELEEMLAEKFFAGMNFNHITGGPHDKVY
ncbi:protein mitoshell [Culicoides brevitarsis]|uniref:protein mitoshell n=1 Tax=Culicoides brevitarsis TaxID=469753 RepID=UPI00307B6D59